MNTLLDSVTPVLNLVLANAVKASVLACAVALICLLLRRWLSPGWRHVLWGVVFVRLLLPDIPVPGWRWNVSSLVPEKITVTQTDSSLAPATGGSSLATPVEIQRDVLPPLERSVPADNKSPEAALPGVAAGAEQAAGAPGTAVVVQASLGLWQVLLIVWLFGAAAWWTALGVSWWRFKRRVIDTATPASEQAQALLEQCMDVAGLRRRIDVRCSPHVSAPSVCGLFRHVILLPQSLETAISRADLHLLLLHELGHVKRRDSIVHLLASVLLGLHWWNPLMWMAWHQLRHEAEAATDAWVLRRTGTHSAPSYGAMLLTLASRACASGVALVLVPTLIRATSRGRRLKQRILDIAAHRSTARWAVLMPGFVVLAGLLVAGFSQEAPKARPPEATASPAPADPSADTIGGIIVDDQDRPIAGAEIEIEIKRSSSKFAKSVLPPGYKAPTAVKSDAEGRWTMSGVPKGVGPSLSNPAADFFFLYVTHPEFLHRGFATKDDLNEDSYRKGTAKLILKRGFSITGVVRDESGQPIAGATVQRGLTSSNRGEPAVTTDAEGRYELKSARAGDIAVRVRAKGFAANLERVDAKKEAVKDFTLKKANTLKLVIRDDKDQPVEGASVAIYPPGEVWKPNESLWEMKTIPADGRVVWDEAPGGKMMVDVVGGRFTRFSTQVAAGEETQIKVPAANRLSIVTIKVTNAATGAPLRGCTIEAGALYVSGSENVSWMSSTVGGMTFEAGAAEGEYRATLADQLQRRGAKFCIRHEGFVPALTPKMDPSKGDATFEVAMQEKKPLEITVLGAKDAPAAGAKVVVSWQSSVQLKDSGWSSQYNAAQQEFVGATGPDGRCQVPPALSDAVALILHDGGFALTNMADLERNPTVRLGLYAQVEGIVTKDGKPVPGAKYDFTGGMDRVASGQSIIQMFDAVSDEKGRIFLPRVLPTSIGRFAASKPKSSYESGQIRTYTPSKTQRVPVGQTTTFQIEVEESQARNVTGRFVLEGGGVPARSRTTGTIYLGLEKKLGPVVRALQIGSGFADDNGQFTIKDVQPGDYTLVISPGVQPKARYAFAGGKTGIDVTVAPLSEDPAKEVTIDLGSIEVVDTQK